MMSDNNTQKGQSQLSNNNNNMNTPTTTSTSQSSVKINGKAILEATAGGKSHRLAFYPFDENGQPKAWDPTKDLSFNRLVESSAAGEALAKFVAGGLLGNGSIIWVTPAVKAEYENATGTGAYVFADYQNNYELPLPSGGKLALVIEPKHLPQHGGVRRLYLDGSVLYADPNEPEYTHSGLVGGWAANYDPSIPEQARKLNDTWVYWYARAARALLQSRSVSISVGPKFLERAQAIEQVINAEDPAVANEQRRFVNRRSAAREAEVRATVAEIKETSGGTTVVAGAGDLLVPVFSVAQNKVTGETTDLGDAAVWPKGRAVPLCYENGLPLSPHRWTTGSTAERIAVVKAILHDGQYVRQ